MITRYSIGKYTDVECEEGDWCRWSDVDPIIAENSELRERLALYEVGKPNKDVLHYVARHLGAYDEFITADVNPSRDNRITVGYWLKRIASANEVTNGKP